MLHVWNFGIIANTPFFQNICQTARTNIKKNYQGKYQLRIDVNRAQKSSADKNNKLVSFKFFLRTIANKLKGHKKVVNFRDILQEVKIQELFNKSISN